MGLSAQFPSKSTAIGSAESRTFLHVSARLETKRFHRVSNVLVFCYSEKIETIYAVIRTSLPILPHLFSIDRQINDRTNVNCYRFLEIFYKFRKCLTLSIIPKRSALRIPTRSTKVHGALQSARQHTRLA